MSNLVFGCDVNVLTSKLTVQASKKINRSSASELAQNVIGDSYITFNPSNGISFEKFVWVVFRNKLNDKHRMDYVRKNNVSINADTNIDMINTGEDLVQEVKTQASELLENNSISLVEYNIIIMKSLRYSNQEIAKELELSEGRISQIYAELVNKFGNK